MTKKTEAEFEKMIEDVDLTEKEKNVLREDVGLPVRGETETIPVLRKRLQLRAWSKVNPQSEKTSSPASKPVLKVLKELDDVGLRHSMVMGRMVILEGGIDILKSVRVKSFQDAVTGGTGLISGPIMHRNMLSGRRVLLRHVVDKLKSQGATIKKKMLAHELTVDEIYDLEVDGSEVSLALMPH